jgi:hypothetical protein
VESIHSHTKSVSPRCATMRLIHGPMQVACCQNACSDVLQLTELDEGPTRHSSASSARPDFCLPCSVCRLRRCLHTYSSIALNYFLRRHLQLPSVFAPGIRNLVSMRQVVSQPVLLNVKNIHGVVLRGRSHLLPSYSPGLACQWSR